MQIISILSLLYLLSISFDLLNLINEKSQRQKKANELYSREYIWETSPHEQEENKVSSCYWE